MRSIAVIVCLFLVSNLPAQESLNDILNFDDCPEIEIQGEPEMYIGDDLFNLINGGAELYHEFGFVEVLSAQLITPGSDGARIEIYDMGSSGSAWGIYSLTSTSNSTTFQAGVAGRKGEGFAQFIKGNYMVYMYFSDIEDSDLQRIAGCLSSNIELSMPEPEIMKVVESGREDPDKLLYFRGNLGLSAIYNFHYKDVFGYVDGAAAIYPDLKVFLLSYENQGSAIENFNAAEDFFLTSKKYHDQVSMRESFHVKDRKEQQIDIYVESALIGIFISSGEEDLIELREKILNYGL